MHGLTRGRLNLDLVCVSCDRPARVTLALAPMPFQEPWSEREEERANDLARVLLREVQARLALPATP